MPSRAWNFGKNLPGLRPSTTILAEPTRSPAYGSQKPSRVTAPRPFPLYAEYQSDNGSGIGSPPASHRLTWSSQNSATRSRAPDTAPAYRRAPPLIDPPIGRHA